MTSLQKGVVGAVAAVVGNGVYVFCQGRVAGFAQFCIYKATTYADKN